MWVWPLSREDPTCHRAINTVHQKLLSLCSKAGETQLLSLPAAITETHVTVLHNKRNHGNEKPVHCNEKSLCTSEEPAQPTINQEIKLFKKEKFFRSPVLYGIIKERPFFSKIKLFYLYKWQRRVSTDCFSPYKVCLLQFACLFQEKAILWSAKLAVVLFL